jgi:hypothetical protein
MICHAKIAMKSQLLAAIKKDFRHGPNYNHSLAKVCRKFHLRLKDFKFADDRD